MSSDHRFLEDCFLMDFDFRLDCFLTLSIVLVALLSYGTFFFLFFFSRDSLAECVFLFETEDWL